jgi:hypothetical protein
VNVIVALDELVLETLAVTGEPAPFVNPLAIDVARLKAVSVVGLL